MAAGRQGLEDATVELPVGICSLPSGAEVTSLLMLIPSQEINL